MPQPEEQSPRSELKWTLPLIAIIVLSVAAVLAILFTIDAWDPNANSTKLLVEIAKTVLQLCIVGVVGGAVKLAFDEYTRWQTRTEAAREKARAQADARKEQERQRIAAEQARAQQQAEVEKERQQEQAAAINEFRKDMLRRLINANARVRRAPILIEAARSPAVYDQQIHALIDVWIELSIIRHEIQTAGFVFVHWNEIREYLVTMERYLNNFIYEYRSEYAAIADQARTDPGQAWEHIQNLGQYQDFVNGSSTTMYFQQYVRSYFTVRDMMRQEIWASVGIEAQPIPDEE
ncbi:MAG: hypothetical protein JW934_19500 [Anaerolineae bacterium]|nr:hypothetical protein [Anaerolineae bacterium]